MKDADTGKSLGTKSMNSKHSNFAKNVSNFVASKLGNGAQITGVTAQTKGGDTMDLMNQQTLVNDSFGTSKPTVGSDGGHYSNMPSELRKTVNLDAYEKFELHSIYLYLLISTYIYLYLLRGKFGRLSCYGMGKGDKPNFYEIQHCRDHGVRVVET
ncbi:hypothetical protein [Pseudoalteromonas ruthenica]|nr:hypothetical protein [Pseudoalteromonas ruthenica]